MCKLTGNVFSPQISLQTEPKLLPQVEEVTYAEPVLLPQPPNPNKMHQPPMGSPKSTLRKPMMGHHHGGVNSETLFQVRPAFEQLLMKFSRNLWPHGLLFWSSSTTNDPLHLSVPARWLQSPTRRLPRPRQLRHTAFTPRQRQLPTRRLLNNEKRQKGLSLRREWGGW